MARLFDLAGPRLFARNVRGFLGNTSINRGMEATLRKEPENFWYFNNGITILCDAAEFLDDGRKSELRLESPQVINGQQTTRCLARHARHNPRASVLVKIMQVPPSKRDGDHGLENLVSTVVAATNWQNAIRPSDLMSNDRRQIEIERALRQLRYLYLRKRQITREAKGVAGVNYLRTIKKEKLAQAVAGCNYDPSVVRAGKEKLFEEALYTKVFPNSNPHYYLPRYFLMDVVARAARGYPERAYAKWLVFHFAWSKLARSVAGRSRAERFRRSYEDWDPAIRALKSTIDTLFVSALQFYRANRGVGAKAIDVSAFFQLRGRGKQFQSFWRSKANTRRVTFHRRWKDFEKKLGR